MFITERIHARATLRIHQERAVAFNPSTGRWIYEQVGQDEEVGNLILNAGRVQIHTFAYGTAPRTNGFNYIAVTNDVTAPAAGDLLLTGELTTNGFQRVQGVVTLPTGAGNITTVANTFTYTGPGTQAVQKSALFDSLVAGVMAHEILFTQRTLATNDTIGLTFSITLG